MKIKKLLLIVGLTFTISATASSKDDAALNKFVGNKTTTINSSYGSTKKVVTSNTCIKTSVKPTKKYSKRIYKKKRYSNGRRYSKLKTTYFINYIRPGYRVIDNYKNYDFNDLSIDYKKQIDEENRMKDTL